ncbi:MAG TPA: TetR/AcrR family transcriptional regulator [Acidimicrobiales bacterium]|jgi:AcrR family transcriptional regulator|nr:TetR/AcrR family transcriptional regulator [Acidimicrobiales bacterium]
MTTNRPRKTRRRATAGADDRSRQPRGDARRQQILDSAVELFAANGYRGTGIAALADKVGMTAPGLLYYFGTKERLLQEVMEERQRAEGQDLPSIEEFTLDTIREIARHNVETAVFTRLYVVLGAENLDRDDPLHDFFTERYAAGRAVARETLLAEQRRGVIDATIDVDLLAAEILAVLMGLEIQWLVDPANVDLVATVDAYIDRLSRELERD